MSDSRLNDLADIENFIYKGRFNEALQVVETLEKAALPINERLTCQLLKSIIFKKQGNFLAALKSIEQIFQEVRGQNRTQHLFNALIEKIELFWHLRRVKDSFTLINQAEQLLATLAQENPETLPQSKASLLYQKGILQIYSGNFDQALEYLEQSLALREKVGNKQDIAWSLNEIGIIFSYKGDYNQSLKYHQQSLALRKEIGNKQDISGSLGHIARLYANKSDFSQALQYHQQSLALRKEIGSKKGIAGSLYNISQIYVEKGDFNRALKHL
ncbi:MAG: tetratricopeptide repeat protein, partial [Candidatus Hodarchaeota archaeon]